MERKPFHRGDFTGSAGPGLAKLRAAKPEPDRLLGKRVVKATLAELQAMMRGGHWNDAILAAAKYHDLGDHAAAIHRGREALLRPSFQRQLRRDPVVMIAEAKAALLERFGA